MLADTVVLIDQIRGYQPALAWLTSLPDPPLVSGFAALELAFGSSDAQELSRVESFLKRFPILWPDAEDVKRALTFSKLRLSGGLGILDALTAALAIGHGQELLTFNLRHFKSVPGLKVLSTYSR